MVPAGSPVHEVTPAMIKAGLRAYAGFNEDFSSREEMLREVWEAMASVANASISTRGKFRGP